MPIELDCIHCATRLRVPDEHAGKKARCPKCEELNQIPAANFSHYANLDAEKQRNHPLDTAMSDDDGSLLENPYAVPEALGAAASPKSVSASQKPHRGSTILVMGILAIFCNLFLVPGLYAWIGGRNDLRDMKAGLMDRQGEDLTRVGMIIGIVMTCLAALGLIVQLFLLFAFGFGAALQ